MSTQPLHLKPQDVCVLLQLSLSPGATFRELSERIGLSVGEVHNATKRLEAARLCSPTDRSVNRRGLLEFLLSGVPYAFPGELGTETRGVPTAHSGPAMRDEFDPDQVVVWPSASGNERGLSLAPLCPSAPAVAGPNPELYRLLTLVDALRIGRARERESAGRILRDELGPDGT
ncbi:MAG TPA: helix-turn-helix domain-containing protein [Longimicrobiales bacterium]|nr:helix-turn-helix domain-containing protein [Longimicrobiales bacterium]